MIRSTMMMKTIGLLLPRILKTLTLDGFILDRPSFRGQDRLHFSLSQFSQFWEYKYNKITFGGFNYFLYTSKLFKTIVEERENGEGPNSSFTYIIFKYTAVIL
jgi:hypothetical protein